MRRPRPGWPRQAVVTLALLLVLTAAAVVPAAVCRSGSGGAALSLTSDGIERDPTVTSREGQVLMFNLRTVEPRRLYRSSAFPRNVREAGPDGERVKPAALHNEEAFELVRSLGIRQVLLLTDSADDFYAEEGYFRYWRERTGYDVKVTCVPVAAEEAYGTTDRSGLHAAAVLVAHMRHHRPEDGAVLVQGEAGKDAVGVAVAGYELWRNRGRLDPDTLWRQVTARYLQSNRGLRDVPGDTEGVRPGRCAQGEAFVCAEWLAARRWELESVAGL